jgi:hypothetical protein
MSTNITTPARPTSPPLPVILIQHGLSTEVIVAIVCAVFGTVVPLGMTAAKYAIKRYRSKSLFHPNYIVLC